MTTELGEFLRSRRAAISPEEAGVVSYGARRVPGLRREELAQLAGVSLTYYTRLEQSDQYNASDSVLDAIARALRLTTEEHEHLRRLARPAELPLTARCERPSATALGLMHAAPGPAIIVSHTNDIVAWNELGHRLLGLGRPHDAVDADQPPNITRDFFLHPAAAGLYVERDAVASSSVGYLRYASGLYPDDTRLSCLVGELVQRSDAFAALWATHPVSDCGYGIKRFDHPEAGRLDLGHEALALPHSRLRLVAYSAAEGSDSARRLARLAATGAGDGAGERRALRLA